jgi:HTH-type transcriptional regulator, quorum sensing regulator NprR
MIGERIYYFRKLNGQTQEELAHGICSISHLSKIENGHETPSDHILEHLCRRLNTSLKDIDPKEAVHSMNEQLDSWNIYLTNQNIEESTLLYKKLAKQLEVCKDPPTLLKYKLFHLDYCLLTEDLTGAAQLVRELKPFKVKLEPDLKFHFLFIFGNYYFKRGAYLLSLKCYIQAEELMKEKPHKSPELYYRLALVNLALYRTYYSAKYAETALSQFNDNCNFARSIDCQNVCAINAIRVNHFTEATKYLDDAFHISRLLREDEGMSWTYCNLGYLSFKQGEIEKSIHYYEKSLDLSLNEDSEKNIITCYRLARSYHKLNQMRDMKKWIQKGLALAEELKNVEFAIHFKVLESKFSAEDSTAMQEKLLKNEVIPYFKDQEIWFYVAKYSEILAEYYAKQFKYKSSTYYYNLVNEARKKIYLEPKNEAVLV